MIGCCVGFHCLCLLYIVQNIHRSIVGYYWISSLPSFKRPMALIDDKTWSLYNSFTELAMESLVRNRSSYYHIVSMEKLALVTSF